jgi:hypothetical protein
LSSCVYDSFCCLIAKTRKGNAVGATEKKTANWKKRLILLQDNFLFCYKVNFPEVPVVTIRLHNYNMRPMSERDVGKPHCFRLVTPNHSYYFAAANPTVLVKWLSLLNEVSPWYLSRELYQTPTYKVPPPMLSQRAVSSLNIKSPSNPLMPIAES